MAPDLPLQLSLDSPVLWDHPSGNLTGFQILEDMTFSSPNGDLSFVFGVPEPGTFALAFLGLLVLLVQDRRRRA